MTDLLRDIHPWVGYVAFAVVVVSALAAFNRGRNAQEFTTGLFSAAVVLLDLQVTLGIVLYVLVEGWDATGDLAYAHPALMLLGLVVAHVGLGRARREQMVADAHRTVGRAFVAAAVLIAVGIGLATMA